MKCGAYHHIFKEAVPEYWQDSHTVLVCLAEEIVESIRGAVTGIICDAIGGFGGISYIVLLYEARCGSAADS